MSVASKVRLGAVVPAALHVTFITYPSLVLIIQSVLKPFVILLCFSPCCLGPSWTQGAGKIRGIRKESHRGKYKQDVLVQSGGTRRGKMHG